MKDTDRERHEGAAYEQSLLKNIAVQDALIIMILHAAQLDLESEQDCREEIGRIEAILEQCPVCVLDKGGIFTRIHKHLNMLRAIEPRKALGLAAEALGAEFRDIVLDLAVRAALQGAPLNEARRAALVEVAELLGFDRNDVDETIQKCKAAPPDANQR